MPEALELIRIREEEQLPCDTVPSELAHKDDQIGTGVGATHGSDVDTDPQLDMAFSESEQDVLLRHQQDLQEIILRSKVDCATGSGLLEDAASTVIAYDRLALLCFNRRPKELFDALLASPLAARVSTAGVTLQPTWAGGKLILAEGVTESTVSEAREEWHVAVRAVDEDELIGTLRSILGRDRLRVKASHGRILVPRGTSLFQLSDASIAEETQRSRGSKGPGPAINWAEVTWKIFIHIPVHTPAIPQTSASAPAEL